MVATIVYAPRPKYEVNVLVTQVANDVDYIDKLYHNAFIIIGGDV